MGVLLNALLASGASSEDPRIIDRPIPFGPLRQELTLRYIRQHYDPEASGIDIVPRAVVIHWTASPTLASALATFTPEILPKGRPELEKGGRLNVSAHFVVDRDGAIYRFLPETRMARHAIGLNRSAIGIENVGGPKWPLTRAQLVSNEELVRYLTAKYPAIRHLLGHQEYLKLRGTDLWEERDLSYVTRKPDPGMKFMANLRESLKDLALLQP